MDKLKYNSLHTFDIPNTKCLLNYHNNNIYNPVTSKNFMNMLITKCGGKLMHHNNIYYLITSKNFTNTLLVKSGG
jgi:hypothetical protein